MRATLANTPSILRRRRRPAETIQAELAVLVTRRQELRSRGAGDFMLELNRRKIVRRQQELAHALIARYSRPAERTAA